MIVRSAARRVAASVGATAAAGALVALAFASPAGAASSPQNGTELATAQPQGTFTAGTPFDSGQLIDVSAPANTVFDGSAYNNNTTAIKILECAAPNGVIPTSTSACDGNTIATDFPATDGSFDMTNDSGGYKVFYLPDSNIGDSPSGPKCGDTLATECILYIGNAQGDFTQPHIWSQPFLVHADPNKDSGSFNPGDGTPEVPTAILLPIAALGLLGGALVIRRRRHHAAAHGELS